MCQFCRESPGAILSQLGGQETDDSDIALQGSILKLFGGGGGVVSPEAESKEKHGVWDPMPGVDYKLTLCPLQSRLQHIYHGQPYARVDPMPELTLSPSQGLWIWPLFAFEAGPGSW